MVAEEEECVCVVYGENADASEILLPVVGDYNTSDNGSDDSQQQDEKAETYPSLFASGSGRRDRFVCVLDSGR